MKLRPFTEITLPENEFEIKDDNLTYSEHIIDEENTKQ